MEEEQKTEEKAPRKKSGCMRWLVGIGLVSIVILIAAALFYGEELARYGYDWRKDTILEHLPKELDAETFKRTLTEFGDEMFERTLEREDVKAWVAQVKHAFRDGEFLKEEAERILLLMRQTMLRMRVMEKLPSDIDREKVGDAFSRLRDAIVEGKAEYERFESLRQDLEKAASGTASLTKEQAERMLEEMESLTEG